MEFGHSVIKGHFIRRLNRFAALVEIEGEETLVHVTNSGRMAELLVKGAEVFLRQAGSKGRKTDFDLVMVLSNNLLVSLDSHLPNKLFFFSWQEGFFKDIFPYSQCFREVNYGQSRIDFLLQEGQERCFVELKSVTLVQEGKALFPDAPTQRGSKHLEELIRAKKNGLRAAVLFIIQRQDAASFSPNSKMDLIFSSTLNKAKANGVEIYAFSCLVTKEGIALNREVPVIL